jgi:hypothetical protein
VRQQRKQRRCSRARCQLRGAVDPAPRARPRPARPPSAAPQLLLLGLSRASGRGPLPPPLPVERSGDRLGGLLLHSPRRLPPRTSQTTPTTQTQKPASRSRRRRCAAARARPSPAAACKSLKLPRWSAQPREAEAAARRPPHEASPAAMRPTTRRSAGKKARPRPRRTKTRARLSRAAASPARIRLEEPVAEAPAVDVAVAEEPAGGGRAGAGAGRRRRQRAPARAVAAAAVARRGGVACGAGVLLRQQLLRHGRAGKEAGPWWGGGCRCRCRSCTATQWPTGGGARRPRCWR